MRFKSLALLAFALTLSDAAPAIAANDKAPAVSASDAALISRAESRGRLMYAYDQAAWHGTDDIRAKLPDFATRVESWIVDGPVEAPELVFYSRDKDNPKAIYIAHFSNNELMSSKVLGPGDDPTLSPYRLKMIDAVRRARLAMVDGKVAFCATATPNTIVLPPEAPKGPHLVYFLTPQVVAGSLPFGGHYLFEVAAGGTVTGPRRFTNDCLELPITLQPGAFALGVTHLLDPVPTEIHVFSQISAKIPIMVVTTGPNPRAYLIKDGKIERLPDDKLKGLERLTSRQ